MPRLTRRLVARASLAAGGTVVGALLARKLIGGGGGPEAASDAAGTPPPSSLATLRPDPQPKPFPRYVWQRALPDGRTRPGSVADYAGRPILLNLWATWCEPCGREMPSLARLAVTDASQLAVLPVSIDHSGAEAVRAFYDAHHIEDLPVLLDPQSDAMQSLGVTGLPTTFLVGADGRLRARFEGAADWSAPEARAALARLIGWSAHPAPAPRAAPP